MSTYYRKRPVAIQAYQIPPTSLHDGRFVLPADCPAWLREAWKQRCGEGAMWWDREDGLVIGTLEGVHLVRINDWIIRGVKGELYPCKPDIFEATYEPVGETSASGPGLGSPTPPVHDAG
jgi:hypothetical protein